MRSKRSRSKEPWSALEIRITMADVMNDLVGTR